MKKYARSVLSSARNYSDDKKYTLWLKHHPQTAVKTSISESPLLSIIVPTYNTPENFFREMIESVLAQAYSNWELIIVDDCSPDARVRDLIEEYASKEDRIKYKFLRKNNHIAGATNEGIKLAAGEFIALLDHDDLLHPNALLEVAKALQGNQNLDFIYTDEDKVNEKGKRLQPFLKPGWNPDFLHSVNYITHFTTIRKSVLDKFGYEDGDYNGAQDWELFLRIIRNIPQENIHHIPKILYSWRVHAASTAQDLEAKPYVIESQKRAIEKDLEVRGCTSVQVDRDTVYPGQWHLEFGAPKNPHIASFSLNKPLTYRVLMESEGEYLLLSWKPKSIKESAKLKLAADAGRSDIGLVLSKCTDSVAMQNVAGILSPEAATLVAALSRRNVAKHLYTTTRYNIREVRAFDGVILVEREKVKAAVSDNDIDKEIAVSTLSKMLITSGYRNLYNPYVKC